MIGIQREEGGLADEQDPEGCHQGHSGDVVRGNQRIAGARHQASTVAVPVAATSASVGSTYGLMGRSEAHLILSE